MTQYNNTGTFKRYSNELETFEEEVEEDIAEVRSTNAGGDPPGSDLLGKSGENIGNVIKSHDYNGENSVYIIFVDGKISGYVKDEKTARMTVFNTASSIVNKKKQNNDRIKVYIENVENGINIYSQTVGVYVNGFVNVENKIHWVRLDPYEI